MNAMRKYAVWIIGLGLAAFIIPSVISGIGKSGSMRNSTKTVPSKTPYEPPFRQDGIVYALNSNDTVAAFKTEYAKNAESIEVGMMYRKNVSPDMAMLFFMEGGDLLRSFWMKNTMVSLDIIYIDANGMVVSIKENAQPLNTTSLPSEGPASYVLEVLGGTSAKLGLKKGTEILWSDN
ncbi:DUF192 domain-containing protein [Schleiferiaceae bacterium]|nr:hypothetical protein [Flavobacteriales bacterium]MDC1022432.1 DUF192 domain-containing protein [Schleiferiaceae bacterium]|tara:strand:- start:1072 stop:1605 length:534 start_codon:yes stop_codon:yes gene_type:complete